MKGKRVCSFDIDGVLNFYPDCWVEFIEISTGKKFESKEEARLKLGDEKYLEIKDKYRTSEFKANLNVRQEGVKLIERLSKWFEVLVVTSRPFDRYPELRQMTENWLTQNKINFSSLEPKKRQLLGQYPDIEFHVDDEYEEAQMFLEKGIKVFWLYSSKQPKETTDHRLVTRIENLNEVAEIVNKYFKLR